MTVYIIEDDAAVRDALQVFVEQHGRPCVCFNDAESFFAAGIPTADDTVLVDIGLPGIDGTTVINWVQALMDAPRVIAISGQSQTMIRDILDGLPAIDILRKPLSASELALHL